MADDPGKRRDLGYYSMIQIGLEMAAPVALGIWLDTMWGWLPWLTVSGAFLGFALGMVEITRVGKKSDEDGKK